MKKQIYTLFIAVLFALPLTAQSTTNEEFRILQNHFQKDKKEIIGQALALEGTQASGFWTVYEEYESKRMNLGAERFKVIKDYLGQYSTLTDEQATALSLRLMDNDKSLVELKTSYFKKFAKVAGGKNTLKFYQIDTYLDTIVRQEIMDQIPFIDEFNVDDGK